MQAMEEKVIATNRKARHDYDIFETFEAGLAHQGSEIKSIRSGHVSVKEAHVRIDETRLEAWLVNAHIAPYDPASRQNHDPVRNRKLLLHKREIAKLREAVRQKGMTVIPLRVYLTEGRAKVEIALARGRKNYDKRDAIAKRDMERDLARQSRSEDR